MKCCRGVFAAGGGSGIAVAASDAMGSRPKRGVAERTPD